MNYKFLKLLFTNLVNLEEKIKVLKQDIATQTNDSPFIKTCQYKVDKFEDIVLEYENIIKAYVENHK